MNEINHSEYSLQYNQQNDQFRLSKGKEVLFKISMKLDEIDNVLIIIIIFVNSCL